MIKLKIKDDVSSSDYLSRVDSNRILVSVLLTGSVRRVSERYTLGIVLTESSVEIILAHQRLLLN